MDKLLYKRRTISLFLLLFALTLIIPSHAQTENDDIEVLVTELDGQIVLQWKDPGNILYSRMKITGAGKTVYVDKGVQQAVFSGLINGVQYMFRLSMISSTGVILGETVVSGVPRDNTPPGRVSDVNGVPGDGSVFLYWNDPDDSDLDKIRVKFEDRVIEVDKGVGQLSAGGLENGKEYRFVITALDTSGNESESVEIRLVPGAEASISLRGPETVRGGDVFPVRMTISSSRTDIYAVQAGVQYDPDFFKYSGYDEPENNIKVVHVDANNKGTVTVYVASTDNSPITGQDNHMITLKFEAENVSESHTVMVRTVQALAGTSSGDQVPVVPGSVQITLVPLILPEVYNVSVIPGDSSVTLRWTDPDDDGYDRILITVNGTDEFIAEKGRQTITIPNLVNGQVYEFVIKTMDSCGNTSRGVVATAIPGIPGDLNCNGVIDAGDLAIAAYHYLTREGDPEWEQAKRCDITGTDGTPDGIVDIQDITFIALRMLEQQ